MRISLLRIASVAMLALPAMASAQSTTAANPPGTVVSRTFDRAAGTDTSGAYPQHRVVKHARHRTQSVTNNSVTRTTDRAAGTNTSGAYPLQSDGMPGNPPGTVVSRALGTTAK